MAVRTCATVTIDVEVKGKKTEAEIITMLKSKVRGSISLINKTTVTNITTATIASQPSTYAVEQRYWRSLFKPFFPIQKGYSKYGFYIGSNSVYISVDTNQITVYTGAIKDILTKVDSQDPVKLKKFMDKLSNTVH